MKHLTRYCSLFVCFVLLFVLFSVPVSAEQVEDKNIVIIQSNTISTTSYGSYSFDDVIFFPNNNTKESASVPLSSGTYTTAAVLSNSSNLYSSIYFVGYTDEAPIMYANKNYNIKLDNFYHSALINAKGKMHYIRNINFVTVKVVYSNLQSETITEYNLKQDTNTATFSLEFDCTPSKDIKYIEITVKSRFVNFPSWTENYIAELTSYSGEINGDNQYQFSVEVESQEAGLLKGVIQWLQNIKDGISDLFDSITELPQKIWEFISEGLKSLFVPSEDFIVEFKDKLDTMLEQKLGAVYQVIDITLGSWDDITANDETNTIDFPQVTIPLPNNNSFTFGGYEVRIVPIGMESIANTLKLVVGIVCTVLFINGLRKRYDEIMGVEQ